MQRFGRHAKLALLEEPHEVGHIVDTHCKLPFVLDSLIGPSGSYGLYYRGKYPSVHQALRLMMILTNLKGANDPLWAHLLKEAQELHKGALDFQIDIYLTLVR
ncbi:MAG: hypothetical protein JOZ19_04660 [Rubrobacter sp.]|nr:hypothetical protein [Rubrobacter sp.]